MNKNNLDNLNAKDSLFLALITFITVANLIVNLNGYHKATQAFRDSNTPNKRAYINLATAATFFQFAIIMFSMIQTLFIHINNARPATPADPQENSTAKEYLYLLGLALYAAISALGWKKFQADLLSDFKPVASRTIQFYKPKTTAKLKTLEDSVQQQRSSLDLDFKH